MNSIPGQEPWSSTLALRREQKMTLPVDPPRQVQDGSKQEKTDRHNGRQRSTRKQRDKTEQTKKQHPQQPVTLKMDSFVSLFFFFFFP